MSRFAIALATLTLVTGNPSATVPHAAPPSEATTRAFGVTNIVGVENHTKGYVTVMSGEFDIYGKPGLLQLAPGQSAPWGGWVPWCASQQDYDGKHYITLILQSPGAKLYVWQSNENWQDRIRFHNEPWWKTQAPPIAGASDVNGERILEVRADGSLYLRRP